MKLSLVTLLLSPKSLVRDETLMVVTFMLYEHVSPRWARTSLFQWLIGPLLSEFSFWNARNRKKEAALSLDWFHVWKKDFGENRIGFFWLVRPVISRLNYSSLSWMSSQSGGTSLTQVFDASWSVITWSFTKTLWWLMKPVREISKCWISCPDLHTGSRFTINFPSGCWKKNSKILKISFWPGSRLQ